MNNSDSFQRDEAIRDQTIQSRQKRIDLFPAVNYLNYHRQIFRQPQNFSRMQDAVFSKSLQSRWKGVSTVSSYVQVIRSYEPLETSLTGLHITPTRNVKLDLCQRARRHVSSFAGQ